MTGVAVVVELPRALGIDGPLAHLIARMRRECSGVVVRAVDAPAIGIAVQNAGTESSLLSVPVAADAALESTRAIAPDVSLEPADSSIIDEFLRANWRGFNHLGINIPHRSLDVSAWQAFVNALAASVPAWRLDIGSGNDIVFVAIERAGDSTASVLELVYDRAANHTSVHFCVQVAAARDVVEHTFPTPRGGYKPGDEAFFRSVALLSPSNAPAYIDFAFSEAAIAPWPQTLQAIGQPLGRGR